MVPVVLVKSWGDARLPATTIGEPEANDSIGVFPNEYAMHRRAVTHAEA